MFLIKQFVLKGESQMKNLTKLLAFFFTFILFFTNMSILEAKIMDKINSPSVCAIMVGDADVKSPDFMERLEENLNKDFEGIHQKHVDCDTKIQSLYQNYWFEKGELEEGKLTKTDLHEFVKYSNYDRCLFLIVSDPKIETTTVRRGFLGYAENTRASIEVKAFLVDKDKVLKIMSVTKENSSDTSELRAKRGAFTQCIKEVCKEIRPFLFGSL